MWRSISGRRPAASPHLVLARDSTRVNESHPPTRTKYLGAWLSCQLVLNLHWLIDQINALRAGRGLSFPQGTDALIVAVGAATTGFFVKVWKEVELDAVRSTAGLLRLAPRAAVNVLQRLFDRMHTCFIFLWPGYTGRYCSEICYGFGIFNDKGLGLINANRLDLQKVYVELQASSDVNLNTANMTVVSEPVPDRSPIWHYIRRSTPSFAISIIGVPGSGKTTLLHHLLLVFAAGRQYKQRVRARIPFFMELRRLPELLKQTADAGLAEAVRWLIDKDERYADIANRLPPRWVEQRLSRGRCILLLDGLDEIADPTERKQASQWLDRAVMEHRRHIFIVSARPAGYRSAPLNRARVLEVQPFTYAQTKRFVYRWYHANEVVARGNRDNPRVQRAAERDAGQLLHRIQANPGIRELTSNPLLLTMVCMVNRYRGALPGSRGQLYEEICEVLLDRWRQTRGIEDNYSLAQKLDILRPVALAMMHAQVKEITLEALLQIASEPLARIGVAEGAEAARQFLLELQANSGLFLERESGTWSFAHLSFQEYLCSESWIVKPNTTPTTWDSFVNEAWWRETILLYCSRASDASHIVRAALGSRSVSGYGLAFGLYSEKLSLDPSLRVALEDLVSRALTARIAESFAPAAEAWLAKHYRDTYTRLVGGGELSAWITQAEFQLFLLYSGMNYSPIHWRDDWFNGDPKAPIFGADAEAALEYASWLSSKYSGSIHRLPTVSKLDPDRRASDERYGFWCRESIRSAPIWSGSLDSDNRSPLVYSMRQTDWEWATDKYGLGVVVWLITLACSLHAATTAHPFVARALFLASFILPVLATLFRRVIVAMWDTAFRRPFSKQVVLHLLYAIAGSNVEVARKRAIEFHDALKARVAVVRATPLEGPLRTAVDVTDLAKVRRELPALAESAKAMTRRTRPALWSSVDQLLANIAVANLFRTEDLIEIRRILSHLEKRHRGDEEPGEGIRLVRERP
jgi:hypothetical protein